MRYRIHRLPLVLMAGVLVAGLSGCSTLGYYGQALSGHLELVSRAEPLDRVLQRKDLDPETRKRLERALEIRHFASEALGLPRNGSYTQYADIGRPYAVWNVIATPEFSVYPLRSCYLVAGCVSYRGYFDPDDARANARELRELGFDVMVSGSQAYSTLGWFDDPLLNTFINQPGAQLVNIIVHELAHQRLYIKGDSAFNEAFATAVAREGVRRWFEHQGVPEAYQDYIEAQERRSDFHQLLVGTRKTLKELYRRDLPETVMRSEKAGVFAALQEQYVDFKQRWDGYKGFDAFMQRKLDNAQLALFATYREHVPAFEALIARHNGDMAAFYQDAARIGNLPKEHRQATLIALAEELADPVIEASLPLPSGS
ncbi:aminopeptidase [Thiohalomonas denitrificans]|uniref:Predicted aminopeptidase n=1 Tax=Thiohalomonas denitrificans TaxID=415747 RepID=A0A1G5QUC7_9GAMM|nr:aminopeptidase [Thiohalomonas denitrificans]SCZ65276.1 Predicted aminopeptidase [Thiohalomonas denitrificans]